MNDYTFIEKDHRVDINEKDVIPALFERFRNIFHSLSRDYLKDISDMGPGILMTKLDTSQRNGRIYYNVMCFKASKSYHFLVAKPKSC